MTTRTKAAPTLQRWLDGGAYRLDEDEIPAATRELRALLACARACRAVATIDQDGSNLETPTDYWGAFKQMRAALARLRKLSSH